jgi:hypothetical protein
VKVELAAYEPALVLLRPVGAQLPAWEGTAVHEAGDQIAVTPKVSADAKDVSLNAGRLGLHVQDGGGGLPSAIAIDGANLLQSMDLAEGREKPLGPGKGLALMRTGQAKVTATREPAPAIIAEGSVLRGNLGGKELRLPYRVTCKAAGLDDVSVTIGFQMPETVKRTTGALNLELAFQGVDRWAVDTIEGRLEDSVTRFHPVPGDYSGSWLQHPTGDRLWENATLPLDPQSPRIGVRSADSKHWLSLSAFEASPELPIDNIYLRETRGADRKELGPTLVVAWIDGKEPRDLIAGQWYELSFHLSGAYRTPTPEHQTVSLRAEGGNYVIENQHYRLIVGKSGGGVIRSFTSKTTGWQPITGSDTYTDAGFYEKANNEGGQYGSAADWPDLEPEVSCQRDGDRLTLTVTGKLHGSNWNWAFAASPAIEYRKTFICDASDTVRCEVAIKPFARQQMKGFLAHRMIFSAMSEWSATGAKGPLGGKPGGPSERTWQSRTAPLRDDAPQIGFTGGKGESLLISGIEMSPKSQNTFIHQSGASPNLFFAWYDFDAVDVPAAWHTLKYGLRIVPTSR